MNASSNIAVIIGEREKKKKEETYTLLATGFLRTSEERVRGTIMPQRVR